MMKVIVEKIQGFDHLKGKDISMRLEGDVKNKTYRVYIRWESKKKDLYVEVVEKTDGGFLPIFSRDTNIHGGSAEQCLAQVYNHFKFKVPKDDSMGSGLNLDLMVRTLQKKYNFKLI